MPAKGYPVTLKFQYTRDAAHDLRCNVWIQLVRPADRAKALAAIDEALVQLGKFREEVALAGVAPEDR